VSYRRSNYKDKWRIERQAKQIRQALGVDQFEVISPWRLADAVPAHVFYPEDFGDAPLAARLRKARWDGFAFTFVGEDTLIVLLNSQRAETRQAATLMEELSHHLLRHEPCRISRDSATGLLRRSYDAAQEAEAYDLGAATLLAKEMIQRSVSDEHRSATEIATTHGCSEELVVYRIKRLRLWQRYERYAA
jgi:Zn-dependent peptidase ImmA (M78 family)